MFTFRFFFSFHVHVVGNETFKFLLTWNFDHRRSWGKAWRLNRGSSNRRLDNSDDFDFSNLHLHMLQGWVSLPHTQAHPPAISVPESNIKKFQTTNNIAKHGLCVTAYDIQIFTFLFLLLHRKQRTYTQTLQSFKSTKGLSYSEWEDWDQVEHEVSEREREQREKVINAKLYYYSNIIILLTRTRRVLCAALCWQLLQSWFTYSV